MRELVVSRILFSALLQAKGSYLSRIFVTKYLLRYTNSGTGKRSTFVPPTLLPTGVYLASTSRYCWCALTTPLHPYPYNFLPLAVYFCGTILAIACTGSYPASLIFWESGLSSNYCFEQLATTAPTLSISYFSLYCQRFCSKNK